MRKLARADAGKRGQRTRVGRGGGLLKLSAADAVPWRVHRLKILRRLLSALIAIAVLAGILLAAAYSPIVQTWYVERLLARHPELQAKVDSVWAGFSQARLEGVRLQRGNATLTLPTVEIGLPVVSWLRGENPRLRTVVAKDWVLKFNPPAGMAQTGDASAKAAAPAVDPTRAAVAWLGDWLRRGEFPVDVAVDAVDLEGTVICAAPAGGNPTTLHVALKGGRLAAGEMGVLTVEATLTDDRLPRGSLPLRGELKVAMETSRRIGRVDLTGTVEATRDAMPGETPCALELGATPGTPGGSYRLALTHEGRRLIGVTANYDPTTETLAGAWKVDWQAADWTAIGAPQPWPLETLNGAGKFDTDINFARTHVSGHAQASGKDWKALAPWLDRAGAATVSADFDALRCGDAVEFNQLEVAVDGAQLGAKARTLRPVTFDWTTNKIGAGEAQADWLDADVRRVPMAWFSDVVAGYTLGGGAMAGEFLIGGAGDTFTVRSKTPSAIGGVSVRHGETLLARDLEVAATIKAQVTMGSGVWQVEVAPMTFAQGGTTLARIEGKVFHEAGGEKPIALTGRWSVEVAALAGRGAMPRLQGLTARTASGDFSGTLAGYLDLQGKFRVSGRDSTRTLEGTAQVDLYPDGTVELTTPLKFTLGQAVSDVQLDWEWRGDAPERGAKLKLTGKSVGIEAVRALAMPFAAWGRSEAPGQAGGSEHLPFWGDWAGQVRIDFERVRLADREMVEVGGYLEVGRGKVELINGHGGPEQHSLSQVQATLTFDPTRAAPYELRATTKDATGDAENVFGPTPKDGEPVMTGRFTVERALTAKGASLAELMARREERFKLHGKDGIVRGLKTGVAQALPPPPESSGAVNALDNVGTAFGWLLGSKKKSLMSGEVKVSPQTDAVLDLDLELAEIGYDSLTITAIREGDGTIRIPDFDLVAPNLHLTGSGEISRGNGVVVIGERPVSLEMRYGAQGRIAELMEKAGLLAGKKDAAGYRWVEGTFHAGGTLKQLDQPDWRAKLVEAAKRTTKPAAEPAKK